VFTHASTPSITPTVIPTLSLGDADLRLLDLLAGNGDCRLPCLWGIKPGESTYEEAKTILVPLSSISDFTAFAPGVGNITPYYTEGDLIIYTNVDFLINNNIVTRVYFQGRALKEMSGENGVRGADNVFDSTFFGERLRLYMLPKILSEYGRPESVLLSTLGELPLSNRDPGVHFNILLLYPDQGILAHYTTEMRVVSKNVVGCPANAHVELELFPSGHSDSFFELLDPTYWPEKIKNDYKPLEEVTSLSIEGFYQTFRQATDECLETPAILWPVPEK